MKPQDLYRGQAPAAMGMMGQGLMEAGANIGRTLQSGYQALGQGIGAGIGQAAGAVAGAYQEKKKLDAQNKADEGFYKSMLPYFDEATRNDLAARHEDLLSDPSASALDKAAFYHSAKSYLAQGLQAKESAAKVKQYEAEAAYKNAVATMKSGIAGIDLPSLIPKTPTNESGSTLPSAYTPGSETTDLIFEDNTPSPSGLKKIDWDYAKAQLGKDIKTIDLLGGKSYWNGLSSERQQSMISQGFTKR